MRRNMAVRGLLSVVIVAFTLSHSLAQETLDGSRKVVIRVTPQYPALARSMSIRGSVKVEALVAANGTVKSVDIKGGHPVLAQSAQNAVRQWKWEPSPHETTELIEIKFNP
jgi:TonB family protein